MKLNNKNKEIIDKYFETHSEEEVKKAFEKLGLQYEEKIKSYDDLSNKEAFEKLYNEMTGYINYLKESTYHPFSKFEYYASILKKLIDRTWPYEF